MYVSFCDNLQSFQRCTSVHILYSWFNLIWYFQFGPIFKKWTKSLPSTFQSRIKSVGTIIRTISLRNTKPNWKYRLKLSHLYISQVAKSKPYAWKLKNSTHIMVHKKVWRYVSWESIICKRYCKTILTDLIECGEHVFQTWHW